MISKLYTPKGILVLCALFFQINIYAQTVSTFAGSGTAAFANATGTAASFFSPHDVAVDGAGNLYVADYGNHRIRKINTSGFVTTFAGSGTAGSANGTGTAASFYYPWGICVDASGNVYVSDNFNHKIRKITSAGVVTTLAGSGTSGSANGTGTAATFKNPNGICVDASGNVYVAEAGNHKIRKITSTGVVTTFAGSGVQGSAEGTGTAASFNAPIAVTVDGSGNVYVADQTNHKIRKITSAGVVSTLAGSGTQGSANGTGTAASFKFPKGVSTDGGNVYVSDGGNHKIRKITSSGVVTTVAGIGTGGSVDGFGATASFNSPIGILYGSGNLYVADGGNHKIRKIIPSTEINVKAGVTNIASAGSFDFGSLVSGNSSSPVTFTIENLGNLSLTLSATPKIGISGTNAADFTIDQTAVTSPIAAGGTNTFTITFTPSATGARNSIITITNNDSDEGTYTINLTGTGTSAPQPEINVKEGGTSIASNGSYNFGSTNVGTPITDTTFTIENIGVANLILSGTPKIVISSGTDFTINQAATTSPITAGGSTTFTVTFNPSTSGVKNDTIRITNNDADESTYFIMLTGIGTISIPEINITEGAASIASNDSYNFGSSNIGIPTVATNFTIENLGTGNLTLSGTPKIGISGANAADFTIVQTAVTSPVAASGTTSFNIAFTPSAGGARTAAISIANNDSDESTYVINLTGMGTSPSSPYKSSSFSHYYNEGADDLINSDAIYTKSVTGGEISWNVTGKVGYENTQIGVLNVPLGIPSTIDMSGAARVMTLRIKANPATTIDFQLIDNMSQYANFPSPIQAVTTSYATYTINFPAMLNGYSGSCTTINPCIVDSTHIYQLAIDANPGNPYTGTISIDWFYLGDSTLTPPSTIELHILGNDIVLPNTLESYKADIPNPSTYTYNWTYSGTNYFFYPGSTGSTVGLFFTDSATTGKLRCTATGGGLLIYKEIDITITKNATDAYQLAKLECALAVTNCSIGYIDNFSFNSINNISTGCSNTGYTDYTRSSFADTLAAGGVYSANLLIPNTNASLINYVSMWIDYDNDGDFTGSDEFVAESFGSGSDISLTNIVFKNKEGYDGPKRLRVRSRPDAPFTATESCPLPGGLGETEDYLIVLNAQELMEAPQIITPNGDGKNDYFVVRGIKPATENKLTIFDRIGAVVFTASNYENNWNGTANAGDKLNPGTYYFVFTNNNNSIKGFLEIRY